MPSSQGSSPEKPRKTAGNGADRGLAQQSGGRVFQGSPTGSAQDIVTRLKNEIGEEIDRHKIHLEHPIKTTGEHEVAVKLHHDVTVNFKFEVKSTHEEGAKPADTGEPAEAPPKRGLFRKRK